MYPSVSIRLLREKRSAPSRVFLKSEVACVRKEPGLIFLLRVTSGLVQFRQENVAINHVHLYKTKTPTISLDKPDETRNGFTSAREEQQVSMWRYDFDYFLSFNREKILFDWRNVLYRSIIDLFILKKGNHGSMDKFKKIGEKNWADES